MEVLSVRARRMLEIMDDSSRLYHEGPAVVTLDDGTLFDVTASVYSLPWPGGRPVWAASLEPEGATASLDPLVEAGTGVLGIGSVQRRYYVHTHDAGRSRLTVTGLGEPPPWPA